MKLLMLLFLSTFLNEGPVEISSDKARYSPGEEVAFTLSEPLSGNLVARYKHLTDVVAEQPLTSLTWTWTPPATDFKGYLVEVVEQSDSEEQILATVGVDVSSDWKKFPRYGFLSSFGQLNDAGIESVIAKLNKYHINGLQYYDWLSKHHKPLAETTAMVQCEEKVVPARQWRDIFKRSTYRSTTNRYIAQARKRGMKSMMYNLCFGAWKDAAADGVAEQWYIFRDQAHQDKDRHELSAGLSDIFLINPGNPAWQNYLAQQNEDAYKVYDFDGYHIDQLGDRGNRYDYNGVKVNLPEGYLSFIQAMKTAHPNKNLVMNAVSQYGQEKIAQGEVDFLYNEVWSGNYVDYARIINANNSFGGGKPTVFASYTNYNYQQNRKGVFNTPGVLFADAVIFALGGAHLELGEHLLSSEYFPAHNLSMTADLEKSLLSYYDFMVAYENILRDGGAFNTVSLTNTNGKVTLSSSFIKERVTVVGKQMGSRQAIHLLNFSTAGTMDARDVDATQTEPTAVTGINLQLTATQTATKVWAATPDYHACSPEIIPFEQTGNKITFTLPYLKYWTMIIIEY